MTKLTEKNNTSGKQNISLLEPEGVKERLEKLEGWQLLPDGKKIVRNFNFKTFREIIEFFNGLAAFAEKIKHYPDAIIIRFPKVTVELTSRGIKGLSKKDFILAEEADAVAGWRIRLDQWLTSRKVLIFLLIIFILIILWQRFG